MNKFDEVVDYLWDHCKHIADESFMKFLDIINDEKFAVQSDVILQRIKCDYDFIEYFKDRDGLQKLMDLKESEPEKFYECIIAGSNWMNLMARVADINISGQIILNTKDLFKSFIINMSQGTK